MVIPFIEAVVVAFDGVADVSYLVSLPFYGDVVVCLDGGVPFRHHGGLFMLVLIVHGDCDVFVRGHNDVDALLGGGSFVGL